MSRPDFNLLVTLDVLLDEGSVAGAARRLRLSASAMSRALSRLRETTGDPLLVRAGRGLVPTPRALALREQTSRLVQDAEAVLRPAERLDFGKLKRTFTLRASDGFVENFGAALVARVGKDAPGVRLRFVPKPDKESTPLREGAVDVEIGVIVATTGPELRARALFQDRFVGVVRKGHPLSRGRVTSRRYVAFRHILVSRHGLDRGLIDESMKSQGLEREIATMVTGFSAALALVRGSDLVASVPERQTRNLRASMHTFPLPFPVREVTVSMIWHPRLHEDQAHRWMRECVREVCEG